MSCVSLTEGGGWGRAVGSGGEDVGEMVAKIERLLSLQLSRGACSFFR